MGSGLAPAGLCSSTQGSAARVASGGQGEGQRLLLAAVGGNHPPFPCCPLRDPIPDPPAGVLEPPQPPRHQGRAELSRLQLCSPVFHSIT